MLRLTLLSLLALTASCGATPKPQPTPPPPPPPAVQPPSPNLPRSTTDRPDDVSGYQVHFIYTLPSDVTDRELDTNSKLATSVAAINKWFKGQTGGTALRLDTYQGKLDISFARLSRSDAQIKVDGDNALGTIEVELTAMGFNDPKKIYALYYDGSHTRCGGASRPPLLVGPMGALFLKGTPAGAPSCDTNPFASLENQPDYLEFAMAHEIMHVLGATPECAPNSRPGDPGHTTGNPQDLMYAGTEGGWKPSAILDPDRNDYFGHGRLDCLDLAKSVFLEPLPAKAEIPPGWPLVSIPDLGCDKAGQAQWIKGNPVKLRLANARNEAVEVFWINGSGQAILSASLQPFARVTVNTDTTSYWLIKNQAGVCRGLFRTGELLSGMGLVLVK